MVLLVMCSLMHNKREWQTTVDILQIRNGTTTQVGSYNPVTGQIVYDEDIKPIQDVQISDIPRIYKHLSLPAAVILLMVTGVCIIFTTIMLVLFIYYRKSAEIKATSLKLSLLTFVGCYLLYISTEAASAVRLVRPRPDHFSAGRLSRLVFAFLVIVSTLTPADQEPGAA